MGAAPADWSGRPEYAALPETLAKNLAPDIRIETGPGPGTFAGVTLDGTRTAATHWNVPLRQAMITLLGHGIWPLRFARNRGVFAPADQAALLAARAAIIGCGGLGGHVATLLARLGLGALVLCDYDSFDETNLNRQLLARETNLGRNKAEAAAGEVADIASHIEIRTHTEKADAATLPRILADADIVVDCLDSLPTRRLVEAEAHRLGLPFIYGAIAGDEGFAMVSRPGDAGLGALFGAPAADEGKGAEAGVGVPTVTPATLASLEALLAMRVLLGVDDGESVLWHLDLSTFQIEALKV